MKKKLNTAQLRALDLTHLWHPFTRMLEWEKSEPLVIARGAGNYIYDTDGNRYLDGVSSLWVTVHGHNKRELNRAIKAQLDKIAHTTMLGLSNPPAIELAEKLTAIAPNGLTRVFYSDSGSTAVEIALKMAFYYWQTKRQPNKKTKFISFTGEYHGDTIGGMSVGDLSSFVDRFTPLMFKSYYAPYPYCYRCPVKKSYPDCKVACLDKFEAILKKHSDNIAGCIIEPMVQGAAGMITAPPGFLKSIRRLTRKYNVLLIADEVATGFGRTGRMFACEHEEVRPDIMCMAKGITGGYLPLAATLTTEKIYKAFLGTKKNPDAFYHGHTYTGNPLGCAAALANLALFDKEKTLERLKPKLELLGKLLTELNNLTHVGEVRRIGLMTGIELVKDKTTKARFARTQRIGEQVCRRARAKGVIIRPLGDTIVLMPPLSIEQTELQRLVKTVYDSIREVTAS